MEQTRENLQYQTMSKEGENKDTNNNKTFSYSPCCSLGLLHALEGFVLFLTFMVEASFPLLIHSASMLEVHGLQSTVAVGEFAAITRH